MSMATKLTRAEFHVLLALQHGTRHGYGVMQDVETMSEGRLRLGPGTLYTAIKRLAAAGLIAECEADAERRRCYRLTRKGRQQLTSDTEAWAAFAAAVNKILVPS